MHWKLSSHDMRESWRSEKAEHLVCVCVWGGGYTLSMKYTRDAFEALFN